MTSPPGLAGRVRPVRGRAGDADGAAARAAGDLALRARLVRRVGLLRRAIMHGLHPQPVLHLHVQVGL